jgi:GxxExxY protein
LLSSSGMLTNPAGTNQLTRTIIGCAIEVHRELGPGLLESSYKACMVMELQASGLRFDVERPVPLIYKGIALNAGYRVDLLVEGQVVVELKTVDALAPIHTAQVITSLRLIECRVGLLINFNVAVLKHGVRRVLNSIQLRESTPSARSAP